MNLKLAKKIRQGIREMSGIERPGLGPDFQHPGPGRTGGGAMRGKWQDDYEGEIPRKRNGELWASKATSGSTPSDGTSENTSESDTQLTPLRIMVRLKLASARQVYKRAKRMVK